MASGGPSMSHDSPRSLKHKASPWIDNGHLHSNEAYKALAHVRHIWCHWGMSSLGATTLQLEKDH